MLVHLLRRLIKLGLYLLAALILGFGLPRLFTELYTRAHIHSLETAPSSKAALVLGAGLRRDGTPTAILRERVEVAAELYFAGKVQKLLMSGDNRFVDYNEPGAMAAYAESLGVPAQDIVADYAGRRTYDSCYRAKEIFQLNDVLLVTQKFHLTRAVFTCRALGIDAQGVLANLRVYRRSSQALWNIREIPATFVAIWEVWVSRPLPVLGRPEPIFTGSNPVQPVQP